jgi:hypothetical protein
VLAGRKGVFAVATRSTSCGLCLLAIGVGAFLLGVPYYRYRKQHEYTRAGVFETTWGTSSPGMEISYELGWRPRFKDLSFWRTETVPCVGTYVRWNDKILVIVAAYIRHVDFDGVRVRGSDGTTMDLPVDPEQIERRGFQGEIFVQSHPEAFLRAFPLNGHLEVALTTDGKPSSQYVRLFSLDAASRRGFSW